MRITLCGSTTFVPEMKEISEKLKARGIDCLTPEPLVTEEEYALQNGREALLRDKAFFTKRHFTKIEKSDAVLIVNNEKKGIKGYLGANTLIELSVAFYLGKKLYFLNSFDEKHPQFEELAGMNITVLNGSLDKIK